LNHWKSLTRKPIIKELAVESRELLAAARSRSAPRADKAKKCKELFKRKFPELWKRANEVDCRKPENEDGERPPRKEVLNFETKKIKADRKMIAPVVPGMPLRMGFMYKNVRPQIMHLLRISLYGTQAFVKAFGNNAVSVGETG
jgi:hypothetical protein